jgi:hypothetical protein
MSEDDLPKISTLQIDLEEYKDQRKFFLQALSLFKQGDINQGTTACGYLASMYYILPATRHVKLNQDDSIEFIDSIDKLSNDIVIFGTGVKPPPNGCWLYYPEYKLNLGNQMDRIVLNFHRIMHDVGFTN